MFFLLLWTNYLLKLLLIVEKTWLNKVLKHIFKQPLRQKWYPAKLVFQKFFTIIFYNYLNLYL